MSKTVKNGLFWAVFWQFLTVFDNFGTFLTVFFLNTMTQGDKKILLNTVTQCDKLFFLKHSDSV